MWLFIGLADKNLDIQGGLFLGTFFGLAILFAFYLSTGFTDVVSFIDDIIYGIMIEFAAFKYSEWFKWTVK